MAETITDLRGYQWQANDILSSTETIEYKINYISNETTYTTLTRYYMTNNQVVYLEYNKTGVYNGYTKKWASDNYKTIQITGGTDSTNTELITWLQANGTLTKSSTQKLEAPSVVLATNTYNAWAFDITNNNDVDATCSYSFDTLKSTDTMTAGTTYRIGGAWSSGTTSDTLTAYFTADGYEDSDSTTLDLTRPSGMPANKYRSSNDFSVTMPTSELTQDFVFKSNGIEFSGMRATTDTLYYVKSDGTETEVYNTSTKWTGNTEYITILVETDQDISTIFKAFFETLYKTIDNFEYTLKIKGYETYGIKLNLGGTTYEIK